MEDGGDKDMFADEGGENTGMEAKEVEESEDDETKLSLHLFIFCFLMCSNIAEIFNKK